jgi:hypothetical protein
MSRVGARRFKHSDDGAAAVDNSSCEWPEWTFFRERRELRGIVDARERGLLGFRGMRSDHAFRRLSHQLVPSYRQPRR